jgi:hypothetical protein
MRPKTKTENPHEGKEGTNVGEKRACGGVMRLKTKTENPTRERREYARRK